MKKKFFAYLLPLVILAGTLALTPQQEKGNQGKGNKEKQVNPGKSGNSGNQKPNDNKGTKGQNGQDDVEQPGKGKANENRNNNQDRKDDSPGKSGEAKDKNVNAGNSDMAGFKWNKENFKDRKKLKNQNKVTICHKVNGDNPVTISVSENALQVHLNHGDQRGDCTYQDGLFSKTFWNKRENYYDWMERTRDQYTYSQSILDYARQRLADSRSNLLLLRNNNTSPDVIVVRERQVAELDNNVSLLESLLQTAATYLVN